jgi:hypothetical protein
MLVSYSLKPIIVFKKIAIFEQKQKNLFITSRTSRLDLQSEPLGSLKPHYQLLEQKWLLGSAWSGKRRRRQMSENLYRSLKAFLGNNGWVVDVSQLLP